MSSNIKILLDSGAYSSWSKQDPINIKDYIKFVKKNQKYLWNCVNLDVIPGQRGQLDKYDGVVKAAKASYRNLQIMKDAGLNPIPVFHQNEDFKWLEKLLVDGERYIGISPSANFDLNRGKRERWLDRCFSMITDSKGRALVKTHGFGVTSIPLMLRYPWYSVDSTSWTKAAGFGYVFVPECPNGVPDYLVAPIKLRISTASTNAVSGSGAYFDDMGPTQKKVLQQFFQDSGITLGECRHTMYGRCGVVLQYFEEMSKRLPTPFKHRITDLLQLSAKPEIDLKPIKPEFFLFHSTAPNNHMKSFILTRSKITYRLLSYYDFRNSYADCLEEYVEHGQILSRKRKQPVANWNESYRTFRYLHLEQRWKDYRKQGEEM